MTFTAEALVRSEMAASGMVMLAWQLYSPPSDVCIWLNLRVRLDVLPDLNGTSSSIFSPEVMRLEYRHSMAGGVYNFSTTVTLHVRANISPAVGVPALEMLISGAGRSRKKTISWYKCDDFNNFSSNQG